ncbi:MAG: hypothetical protein ABFD96_06100 [Armatimonadia bacterium]
MTTTTLSRVGRMRQRRLALQGGRCHWCDRELVVVKNRKGKVQPNVATEDHVYPRNDPRRLQLANSTIHITKVMACFDCNTKRGNTPYDEFLKRMRPEWREQ